jgi:hypothetical protein
MFAVAVAVFPLLKEVFIFDVERRAQFYFSRYDVPTVFSSKYTFVVFRNFIRKLYKNLSRMKLLMLLIEYRNADKWKGAPTAVKGGQSGPNRNKSYCPRFYTRTNGGAKVKNKGAGIPYPRTTVCEGARMQAIQKGEPTASERVIATRYDPGNDDSPEPTVYTVVCNVNTSLLAKGASSVRKYFRPDTGSYLVGMNHASCCMSPHLDMFVSLEPCPGVLVRGGQRKNSSYREGHHEVKTADR